MRDLRDVHSFLDEDSARADFGSGSEDPQSQNQNLLLSAAQGPKSVPATVLLSPAQKYERLAFTFCKMGTTGLIAWLLTPPLFVLLVAAAAIVLYGRALGLGLRRSRCILRRPLLIMGFWTVVATLDAAWLLGVAR